MLRTSSAAIGNLGTGLVVLLVVPALARGDATVGDVGLFAGRRSACSPTCPRWAASTGAYHRQAEVSVERMARLLPDRGPDGRRGRRRRSQLRHGPGPFRTTPVAGPGRREPATTPSASSTVLRAHRRPSPAAAASTTSTSPCTAGSLTRHHRAGRRRASPPCCAACSAWRRVDDGEVRWNGEPVDDPSQVLVPPRAAYVAQVPRLFSEPLSDAILLGVEPDGLADAVRLACLDDDVAWMPEGLATVVGAKGVRLSGGQIQRTAAARAFVRRPELLVIDDISSALDVDTEARMWEQLLDADGRRAPLLVVSHRPAVLERADQVVELAGGKAVGAEQVASPPTPTARAPATSGRLPRRRRAASAGRGAARRRR